MTVAGNKILIVDEQEEICALLSEYLQREGMVPIVAHSGAAALEKIRSEAPDLLIVDWKLPDMDGMQTMQAAKALDEDLPIILATGYPNIREAVSAMRAGAHDYLEKPLKHHEVLRVVFRALNERKLKRKLRTLSCQVEDAASLRESMGPSSGITRLIAEVRQVAKTNFTVLILGETGAGKDLVARAIHGLSSRSQGPFMAVDCGAIPETLIEGELFGYEKGAFTGADRQKIGKFETALGGTFFLDEVSNMPLGSQAKLLRVLQDKIIHRIGGTRPIDVDVRVLAASNQDLQKLTEGRRGLAAARRLLPLERIRHPGPAFARAPGRHLVFGQAVRGPHQSGAAKRSAELYRKRRWTCCCPAIGRETSASCVPPSAARCCWRTTSSRSSTWPSKAPAPRCWPAWRAPPASRFQRVPTVP